MSLALAAFGCLALGLSVGASGSDQNGSRAVDLRLHAIPVDSARSTVLLHADGTAAGGARALVNAIARNFEKLPRPPAFHRVAISTLSELGEESVKHKLGGVMAELLSVELAGQKPFVLVERAHLDQIMREHRLADLGVLDESTVARFGKVLGAESLVSGSVSAIGPAFIVSVRQIEVETGRVLMSGSVSIDAAGLVALSEDSVVLRSKSDALFRSMLLPGWGQLYNREPVKGVAFMATAVGALGTAGAFYVAATQAHTRYQGDTAAVVGDLDTANGRVAVANAALIGFGVVWLVNVADAYLSGEDAASIEVPASYGKSASALY